MSWLNDKEEVIAFAKSLDSSIIVTDKDFWFWKVLAYCIFFLMPPKTFLTRFATTIGPLHGYPASYSTDAVKRTLVHEARHTKQFKMFGLFIPYIAPWLGILPMLVLYGLLFPIGFNWFRYAFELDANVASWKYKHEKLGWSWETLKESATRTAKIVGSKNYGWPLPQKWVIKGFLARLEKVKNSYNK